MIKTRYNKSICTCLQGRRQKNRSTQIITHFSIHICILMQMWSYMVLNTSTHFHGCFYTVSHRGIKSAHFWVLSNNTQSNICQPGSTQMHTLSAHSHRHTHNIDTEGIPSSSLIQASADWGLDWMEGVRTRGEILRCAGERAGGLQMGGEEGRERSWDQRMGFSLKVLVLSRYSIVNKRVLFLFSCLCCTDTVSGNQGLIFFCLQVPLLRKRISL